MKTSTNAVLAHCTLCYFRLFLQLTLELVFFLFTTNICIVIKKNPLLNMILSIKKQFNELTNGKHQGNKH